ncbi:MAG: TatD family deoxyribonuclease [Limnohabitans sp.]|nr:MAG: TatD family deoxyribonuclease [Limnohabitans sp.]
MWIDTHCHLDAPEFALDREEVRSQARAAGVALCVLPAVQRRDWSGVQALASQHGDAYALGIHPLYVPQADAQDLQALDEALAAAQGDPRLVAVGEIGLDFFVPELCEPAMRERQWRFYITQLLLARKHGLPVILHVRRSADLLLKGLRQVGVSGGIAHAFNGSAQQAQAFIDLGFALGFGGAMTFERATALRELARTLPLDALVLETDAPDIPPQWIYRTAEARANGQPQGRNSPAELPRIAQVLATLRGIEPEVLAQATGRNARRVLPGLEQLA